MKKPKQIAKILSPQRIIIAVMLGLLVSLYLIFRDFDIAKYQNLHWGYRASLWLLMAIVMMFVRDLAYIYRLQVLTDRQINWRHGFQVIMLWEFASALTPSVVGGSAAALYFVSKECGNTGKSTAIVMITALLDELFYIITVPLIFLFVSYDTVLVEGDFSLFGLANFPAQAVFLTGYFFILLLTTIILIAIFFKPHWFKNFLNALFSRKLLKRWQAKAQKTGDEIVTTSKEMKGKPVMFWVKAFGATVFSWTARFLVVNLLILAFTNGGHQLLIYARQLVMWVILLISPTPGGSGVAEYMLPRFLGDFTGGYGNEIALMWRLISYYAYLIIGAVVLPLWLRRMYGKRGG